MIAVVGCGNATRHDDGAGPELVRTLRARGVGKSVPGIRLIDAGTDGMAAMFAARDCRSLIIVDACMTGSPPGAIFEVPGAELEQRHAPTLNLHDFRWDHALYAGRQIFGEAFPSDVVVLLIEAETLEFGIGLSDPIAAAVATVADRVEQMIRSRAPPGQPAA